MPSLIMERGGKKRQSVLQDGTDLMSAGHFCFSCEQIFANRKCLEEHICSSVSFICSCGTEFTEYRDMLEHSTTHEPGHQVLDHETIKKRRIEKRKEEEEKLKRLQKGEVVWKTQKLDSVPSASQPVTPVLQVPNMSALTSQVPMQSAQISQVPELFPSVSQASLLPNPAPATTDMQNIFAGVGAPTVDLWTIYQPVVLLQSLRTFNKKKPYSCGKCGQCFMAKTSLISHHSSHVTDKVSGCIGCGMLLSSKKLVPRFHVCNSPSNTTKFRLITARPLNFKAQNEAGTDRRPNPSAQGPQTTASLQLKIKNPTAAIKASQAPNFASILQLKNENIRTYSNNVGLPVAPSLQLKSQKTYINVSFASKSPKPSVSNRSSLLRPLLPSVQLKMTTNSASGALSRPIQASSSPGGVTCRVCHIAFDTPQLLQRHKCAKAQEFMAQHVRVGKQHYKPKRMTPVASSNVVQMNGERRLVPPSGGIKSQVSLDNVQGVVPVNGNTEVESDDDCYIVESGPEKPAEMIYQVTSSVPIKT